MLNREMRRSGFFDEDDFMNDNPLGFGEMPYRMENRVRARYERDLIEKAVNMEKPEEDYGVKMYFVSSFVEPDMEDAFMGVSAEFLEKEERVRDGISSGLFQDMPFPLNKDYSIRSSYIHTMLLMMLACAEDGSQYAADLIKEFYKAYYKREYTILKKIRTLNASTFADSFVDWNEEEGEDEDDFDLRAARVTVMCSLFHIDIDPSWNFTYKTLNDKADREWLVWKTIEAMAMNDDVLDMKGAGREKYLNWVFENHPELGFEHLYARDRRYDILKRIDTMVEMALEDIGVSSDAIMEGRFELLTHTYSAMHDAAVDFDMIEEDAGEDGEDGKERKPIKHTYNEILMLGYIRHLATLFGRLYKEREEELSTIFGVSRMEPVGYEDILDLSDEHISEEMIERLERRDKPQGETDYKMEKLVKRIESLKPEKGQKQKAEKEKKTQPPQPQPAQGDGMSELDKLKAELQEARAKASDAENKARSQRTLYEESRTREKALEKLIEKQKDEHAELVALRELVHKLENPDEGDKDAEKSTDEMTAELNGLRCAIIGGGRETWANKMRKMFPDWVVIMADDSLSLDRTLGKLDAAFVYTDMLTHKLYYKMTAALRGSGTPYHFIHAVNTDKAVRAMYEAVKGNALA